MGRGIRLADQYKHSELRFIQSTDDDEDLAEWIDGSGEWMDGDDRKPDASEWYLRPGDVAGHASVEDALESRQDDGLPETLWLEEPDVDEEWDVELLSGVEDDLTSSDTRGLRSEMDIPPALDPWLEGKNVNL